jgi:acetyl esterase/lipase
MPAYVNYYLAGGDPVHPYASPLYGNPSGFPPTLIQVGNDEILRDDATRMAEKLRIAGCDDRSVAAHASCLATLRARPA